MKLIKTVFAPISAQAPAPGQQTRLLAEALEKRGEALLTRVKAELEKLRHEGHWHLASALDHQEVIVEALVLTLKAQLANKDFLHNIHHIHVIEEVLFINLLSFIYFKLAFYKFLGFASSGKRDSR